MAQGVPSTINYLRNKYIASDYVADYYKEGHEAKKRGEKICWFTCCLPNSLLYAFDLYTFMPELEGVFVAIDNTCVPYQVTAERRGYDQELCAYARSNLGGIYGGRTTEQGAMPEPDFLIISGGVCTTYAHWFHAIQRHYKVPLFVLDSPFYDKDYLYTEEIDQHHIEYYVNRCKELITFLEEQTGKKFDQDKFQECVRLEKETQKLWRKMLDYQKLIPAPANDWDLLWPLIMIIWFRGTQPPVDIYKKILEEIEDRVKNKVAAVPGEKHRLLFISNPPWYKFETLPSWLAEIGAGFVVSFFNESWYYYSDIKSGSFEDVAYSQINVWCHAGINARLDWAKKLIKEYSCDGMVTMDNRSCKIMAYTMPCMRAEIDKDLNIPSLSFESSMADPRYWSDDQVRTQFETFVELLEERSSK